MRKRTNRLMGGGRTFIWDSFTGTDGNSIAEHASDSGVPWTTYNPGANNPATIDTGRLKCADSSLVGMAWHMVAGSRLRRRHGRVEADLVRVAAGEAASAFTGLMCRVKPGSSGPRGFVSYRYALTNATTFHQGIVNDLTQPGANVSQVLTLNQTYRVAIEWRGPVFRTLVDGVQVHRFEAIQVSRGNRVGCRPQTNVGNTLNPLRLDNWAAMR